MGAGIAYTAAFHGYDVRCIDSDPAIVSKAIDGLRDMADKRVAQGKMTQPQRDKLFARLRPAESMNSLRDAAFVIEAIVEDMAAKRKLFTDLERICPPRTIFATNTSSLGISALAEPLQHPERF